MDVNPNEPPKRDGKFKKQRPDDSFNPSYIWFCVSGLAALCFGLLVLHSLAVAPISAIVGKPPTTIDSAKAYLAQILLSLTIMALWIALCLRHQNPKWIVIAGSILAYTPLVLIFAPIVLLRFVFVIFMKEQSPDNIE